MALEEDSRWKGHHLYGDDYFDPKNDPPLLVIHVTEPLKEGSGLSAHTTYLVTTTVFATKKSYCTRRRYKEFKKLFEEMTKLRGVNLSSFPKKKLLKKFDYDIVEERRLSFEIILREMADHHQIVIAPLFRRFVEVPLNINVFPSDFNINSYTARRRSTITARDQPKHQSISKKAPPPPPPDSSSSSQSSVNQLTSEQMVTVQIPPPPPPQQSVKAVSPVSPQQQKQPPIIPVQTQQEQSVVKRNSQQAVHEHHDSPNTPVIILQPSPTTVQQAQQEFPPQTTTVPPQQQQQPIDVSTFIEEMRLQHQSRQSLKSPLSNPTSPVVQTSEPVKEFDEDVIEVRQVPLPPQRKSQERTSSPQYEKSKTYHSRRMTEEEPSDYSSNFRPMLVEDEAVDQGEEETNFNMAMLNLGAQPIRVQPRMSTGATHTPYHQIKRDSINSKLADMNPEERVQEILRQIKGESNVE